MVYSKSTSVCETEGGGANPACGHQTNMSDKTGNEHNLIVRIETDEYIYEEYSEV